MRLLTLHNLAFVQRLMAALREAIGAGDARGGRRGAAARRRAVGRCAGVAAPAAP